MYYQRLSDDEIIEGFREGDSDIIREYFYGYCEAGYRLFDQRYQLSGKQNLDFMSLAHQYAIYLMEHNWKPLEDHSPEVSLKTWLIGGFRYVVLDALKWYHREYGSITFEDYLQSFDMKGDNLRLQFNRIVEDICDHAPLDRWDRLIITMMLIRGFKGKEVAAECGIQELRYGPGYAGGDGRACYRHERGYAGGSSDGYACTNGLRGYENEQNRTRYGTEEDYTRVYYRDRLPQVWSHHGPRRGSARSELCYPNDAGRRRNYQALRGRVHRVRQGE